MGKMSLFNEVMQHSKTIISLSIVLQVVCGFVTKHLSGPSGQFFCPLALFLSLDRLTFLTES